MSIDADLAAAIALAETEAAARVAAAVSAAQIAATATEQSAVTQAQADTSVATITSNAQKIIAVTNKTADVQVAGIQAGVDAGSAQLQLSGIQYSSDQQLVGVQTHENAETLRLNEVLAFAQDKWNQVWPFVQGFLSNPNSGQGSLSWSQLLAALGPAPWISESGVYTPSQVQAQLNALYARSDMETATKIHDAQIDLAGRGFGGSSPLIDMLRFSYEAVSVQSSVEGAQQLALQLAQANTEMLLNQQSKRQEQYGTNEQTYMQLARTTVELTVGLFDAVSRIISSVER